MLLNRKNKETNVSLRIQESKKIGAKTCPCFVPLQPFENKVGKIKQSLSRTNTLQECVVIFMQQHEHARNSLHNMISAQAIPEYASFFAILIFLTLAYLCNTTPSVEKSFFKSKINHELSKVLSRLLTQSCFSPLRGLNLRISININFKFNIQCKITIHLRR